MIRSIVLAMCICSPAWADNTHQVNMTVNPPRNLDLATPAVGVATATDALRGQTTALFGGVAPSALGLSVAMEGDDEGMSILARPGVSQCGTAQEVVLGAAAQSFAELERLRCYESLDVQFEAVVVSEGSFDDTLAVVTYTVF